MQYSNMVPGKFLARPNRHGDQAAFAYRNMGICLAVMVIIALIERALAVSAEWEYEE